MADIPILELCVSRPDKVYILQLLDMGACGFDEVHVFKTLDLALQSGAERAMETIRNVGEEELLLWYEVRMAEEDYAGVIKAYNKYKPCISVYRGWLNEEAVA